MGLLTSLSSEFNRDQNPRAATMLDTRVTATTSTRPPDPEVEHVGVGAQTAWVQITTLKKKKL